MHRNAHFLKPTSDEIARLAYAIWEHEGFPDGHDLRHWLNAESILMNIRQTLAMGPPYAVNAPAKAAPSPPGCWGAEARP